MVVLVTGSKGQLGNDILDVLHERGHKCFGTDLDVFRGESGNDIISGRFPYCHMDVTSFATVDRVISSIGVDAVVHCASFSDPEEAEKTENYQKVMKINVKGTENVAVTCRKYGIKLLYVSSDFVYPDNTASVFEDEEYAEPKTVFGKSKLLAEEAVSGNVAEHYIVRTQWVYGSQGDNYIKRLLQYGENNRSIRVSNEAFGTPTYSMDLAELIVDMLETDRYGIYNAVNEGGCVTKSKLMKTLYKLSGLRTRVVAVKNPKLEYPMELSGKRVLNTEKLSRQGFAGLPAWDDAISRYLEDIKYPIRVRTTVSEE